MDVLYPRCAGLDVHKRDVWACRLTPGPDGEVQRTVRRFGTLTRDLRALAAWLRAAGCTHVALESTGSYWKPVWNLLEDDFTCVLVNPAHVKAVPGRKSDVQDCQWLAELLRLGLLRPSAVPDRDQRELRELTRYRTTLGQSRSAEVNRLHKTLEGANLKLASVVSDVTGVSATAMLTALVAGEEDPLTLAELAQGQLRAKLPALTAALTGLVAPHQRFLLGQQLAAIAFFDEQIATVSAEIARRVAPYEALLTRLDTIPGVGRWTAEVILAEVGVDFRRFPDAAHLSSWAGMCPGQDVSAGKHRSRHTRPGSPWLRTVLTEAAYAAGRTKQGALGEHYRQVRSRRGRKRAGIAIGRQILELCDQLAISEEAYQEPDRATVDQRRRQRTEQRLKRALERLGHRVILEPRAA